MVIRKLILFLAAGSCSVMFGSSIGTNQTTCPVGSLASYEALASTGCMVSGVTFNNFSLLAAYSNGSNSDTGERGYPDFAESGRFGS